MHANPRLTQLRLPLGRFQLGGFVSGLGCQEVLRVDATFGMQALGDIPGCFRREQLIHSGHMQL